MRTLNAEATQYPHGDSYIDEARSYFQERVTRAE